MDTYTVNGFPVSHNLRFLKHVHDNVHGDIYLDPLDDTIIKTIETASDKQLRESRDLILRICKFCNEYAVTKDIIEHFKDVTAQDIVCSQKNGGMLLKEEDIVVSSVRIDLTRGRHNPLESINFFKDYESEEKFPIPDDRISHLLPTTYQDMIVRVYSKKPELVAAAAEAFENFQLKTIGLRHKYMQL